MEVIGLLKETPAQCFSVNIAKSLRTEHLFDRTTPVDCFWKLNLKTSPVGDQPIISKNIEAVTLKNSCRDCYQLAGNGMLKCKTFYLVNCSTRAVIYTAKSDLLNEIAIKRYSLPSSWEILIIV